MLRVAGQWFTDRQKCCAPPTRMPVYAKLPPGGWTIHDLSPTISWPQQINQTNGWSRIDSALCPELKAAGYTDTWLFQLRLRFWAVGVRKTVHGEDSHVVTNTLQDTNISHLGERKIIFKYALSGGYVNSLEGTSNTNLKLLWERVRSHQLIKLIHFSHVPRAQNNPQWMAKFLQSPAWKHADMLQRMILNSYPNIWCVPYVATLTPYTCTTQI